MRLLVRIHWLSIMSLCACAQAAEPPVPPPMSSAPVRSPSATPLPVPSPSSQPPTSPTSLPTGGPDVSRPLVEHAMDNIGRGQAPALTRKQAVEELVQRLAPSLDRSVQGLPVQEREGGGVTIHLQGRFSHATLARRDADGQLVLGCVDSVDGARHFLRQSDDSSP